MRRWLLTIAGLILVAGLDGAAWLVIMAGPKEPAAEGSDVGYVISPLDRTVGNRKAPVVLIEYAAPVCPHCAAFEIQDFPSLKAKYIDTGKVFYVFRVFPIRPGDGPAEKLAGCLPAENYLALSICFSAISRNGMPMNIPGLISMPGSSRWAVLQA